MQKTTENRQEGIKSPMYSLVKVNSQKYFWAAMYDEQFIEEKQQQSSYKVHFNEGICQNLDQKICSQNLKAGLDLEQRIQYHLSSPNIVKLFEVVNHPKSNTLYYVLEYCKDGNLFDYRLNKQQHKLTELESVIILRQIINGYQELLKKRIIHRDIKPQNILLSDGAIKITDFGFARQLESLNDAKYYSRKGTQTYMSPQILNNEVFTAKCDIWSLGILLYELLYGQLPWIGTNALEQYNNIRSQPLYIPMQPVRSGKMKDLLTSMLQIDEQDRISWEALQQHEIITRDIQPIQQRMEQLARLKNGHSTQDSVRINKFFVDDNRVLGYLDTSVYNSETQPDVLQQDETLIVEIDVKQYQIQNDQFVTQHQKELQQKKKFDDYFQEKKFARNIAYFFNYVVQKLYSAQTYREIALPNEFFDKLIFYLTKQQLNHLNNIVRQLKGTSAFDLKQFERFHRISELKRLKEVIKLELLQIKDLFKMIQTNIKDSQELPKSQAEYNQFCQEFSEVIQEAKTFLLVQQQKPNCSKDIQVLILYLDICQAPLKQFETKEFDFHQFYEDIENTDHQSPKIQIEMKFQKQYNH